MEEATGKQNGSLVQPRTHRGMHNHTWDNKWQTTRGIGLAHNGLRPSATGIPRGIGTAGLRVWPSGSSDNLKPRRRMEPNTYDPGSEIFERAEIIGLRLPAQMKSPVHRPPAPSAMPHSPVASGSQKLGASTFIAKSPPPLSRHPALLKNLSGRIASGPNLVAESGHQAGSLNKPRHTVYNPAPFPMNSLVVQSAQNPCSFTGVTFESLVVNGQTPPVKRDVPIHRSLITEGHPNDKSLLGLQVQHDTLRERRSSAMGDPGNAEQHSYNRTSGEMKPINLCTTKEATDSLHPGEESDMEVTEVEPGKATAQCLTKTEAVKPSKYRRFLLIDNKGMPYTVLVEEPKPDTDKDRLVFAGGFGASGGTEGGSAPRKMYSCPICSRQFEYLSYLQRHSITHSAHKPFGCDICGKAFKRTSHLERHKYTHTVGKPYECQICQRSFRDTGELAHHHRVHTGERPFQCEMCHMRFGERNTLLRHVQRKHPKQPLLDSFSEYVSD
ncbi:uncharacterized protein [Ambystoma mexicanum]|uniref:uncharacterized protein n=1 Tax=Ambystoma mexicanum TaxID=8296 RepID=UPI0037E7D8AD